MRILKILSFFLILAVPFSLHAQSKPVYNVAILLENTRSKNIRYISKDLKKGIQNSNRSAQVNLKFMGFKSASEKLFEEYDALMVISEDSSNLVSTGIAPFVTANKNRKNLLLVNFHKRRANPKSTLKGVDVLTSASVEDSAQPFMIGEVSRKLYKMMTMMMK